MSEFDEALSTFMAEREETQRGEDGSPAESPVASTTAERKGHLRSLIAKGGLTGELASEALVALEEREAKVERDRLAAEAEALAEVQGVDYDDPGVRAALRAQAEQMHDAAMAKIRARQREQLFSAVSEEALDAAMRTEQASSDWFFRDQLPSHPAWQKHELDVFEATRRSSRGFGGLEAEAAEAEVEIELARRRAVD